MANKNTVQAIPLSTLAASTGITTTYSPVNPAGLPNACWKLRLFNDTSDTITISYDGTTDHEIMLTDTILEIYSQNNAQPTSYVALFPIGFTVWVKGTASGSGNFYLSGFYTPSGG